MTGFVVKGNKYGSRDIRYICVFVFKPNSLSVSVLNVQRSAEDAVNGK